MHYNDHYQETYKLSTSLSAARVIDFARRIYQHRRRLRLHEDWLRTLPHIGLVDHCKSTSYFTPSLSRTSLQTCSKL